MVAIKIASALALALSSTTPVLAAAIEARGSASDSTTCYTQLCSTSVTKVKTSWSTKYTPCTTTVTISSKSTSTPSLVTKTSTVVTTTATTAPTSSLTQTQTITNTETDTVIETETATSTLTVTLSTSTVSTVGTSSGFIPVQTSLPGAACGASCSTNPVQKRSEDDAIGQSPNPANNLLGRDSASGKKYPQSVLCYRWTRAPTCSTTTKKLVSTTTAPTPTTTVTRISIVSTTVVPLATATTSTIVTSTTASTSTSTTITVTTVTETSFTATSTIYAACATNNIADSYQGQGVYNFNEGTGPSANVVGVTANTAYDCCVAALNYATGYSQFFAFQLGSSTCYISYGNSCPSGSTSKTFGVNTGSSSFAFGNGYCGEMVAGV